jgi:hypothetical protein
MRRSPLGACAATLAPLIDLIRRHLMQVKQNLRGGRNHLLRARRVLFRRGGLEGDKDHV